MENENTEQNGDNTQDAESDSVQRVVMQKKLQRSIKRCEERIEKLKTLHRGKEMEFTYHGGWSLGYEEGKLAVLEDLA